MQKGQVVQSVQANETVYRELIARAKKASELAYRPYSKYPVGAAVLSFDGQIYDGCNIENCGFTQTMHAEQTAMSKAISEGALARALAAGLTQLDFIKAIAIHAPKGTDPWPCCNCRQSLNEFGLTMDIIGDGPNGEILCETLGQLIPHAFDMNLVLTAVHGDSETTGFSSDQGTKIDTRLNNSDKRMALIQAAKEASQFAYCRYSKYPVGAAIVTFDGTIYTGCNIENCGYTQTIHAEQVALAKAISEGALQRALNAGLTQFEFIESIAVYSPKTAEPWPSCNGRQSLNEFGLEMNVIGEGKDGSTQSKKLKELIPFPFPMDVVLSSIKD